MPYRNPSSEQNVSEADALIHAHLAAIAWIETHLFDPMTVKSIADQAGYSPSRFSRGFTRLQGESVMSYVRGRRLEAAMRRILTDPDVQIVDLAFDSGFDSQEAFTRAFARAFGHPPGRLRSLGPVSNMMRRRKISSQEPEIHERMEQMPELHLAGLGLRVTMTKPMELPDVWRQVESLRDFPGILDSSTYLLILGVDRRDGSVEMMPSIRVAADATPPAKLTTLTLPACGSSVYRHLFRKGDVYPQIQMAREAIFKRRSAHATSVRPLFPLLEVYPQGLGVTSGSWIDHYFPVS